MKKVKIEYEHWSAVVQINYNKRTLEIVRDHLTYRSDSVTTDADEIEEAYLRMLGQKLIGISASNWNKFGALDIINESDGWMPLNDEFGIKLLSMDNWNFLEEDFELTVL